MFKIIDNAIEKESFKDLQLLMMSKHFPWFYSSTVTAETQKDKLFYFTHLFYENHTSNSQYFNLIHPVLDILKPNAIVRVKGNLYPNLGKKVQNNFHKDFEYEHKNALFYLNDNNGPTIFKNGKTVESKANRLLIFDSKLEHASTYCSDEKIRVNINFNYF